MATTVFCPAGSSLQSALYGSGLDRSHKQVDCPAGAHQKHSRDTGATGQNAYTLQSQTRQLSHLTRPEKLTGGNQSLAS